MYRSDQKEKGSNEYWLGSRNQFYISAVFLQWLLYFTTYTSVFSQKFESNLSKKYWHIKSPAKGTPELFLPLFFTSIITAAKILRHDFFERHSINANTYINACIWHPCMRAYCLCCAQKTICEPIWQRSDKHSTVWRASSCNDSKQFIDECQVMPVYTVHCQYPNW